MKKVLCFFLVAFLWSCRDVGDEPLVPIDTNQEEPATTVRSISEAIEIANEFANNLSVPVSRAMSRFATGIDVKVITSAAGRSACDTLLYAVNFANNQGFALIAAPRNVAPLLALVESGNYEETVGAGVEGFDLFLESAKSTSRDSLKGGGEIIIPPLKPVSDWKTEIDTLCYVHYTPRLNGMDWGQHFPEGELCPNGVCGCVTTAMMLAMSYFQLPASIGYSYPGHTMTSETINWNAIKAHKKSSVFHFSDNCSGNTHQTIARIAREIGHVCEAEYKVDPKGNSTSISFNKCQIKTKGYMPQKNVSKIKNYTFGELNGELGSGLAIMCGEGTRTHNGITDEVAHAWVCDGRYELQTHVRIYESTGIADMETGIVWKLYDEYDTRSRMLHFNFGWNGTANGYYSGDVIDIRDQSFTDKYTKLQFFTIK